MIEKLTKEQEKELEVYRDKWIDIGRSCEPVDLEVCKPLVCEAYKSAGLEPPKKFFLVDSPVAAIEKVRELDSTLSKNKSLNDMIYGSHDASWMSFYDYMDNVLGLDCVSPLRPLIELSKNCGWWSPYEDVAIIQQRHCELNINENGELHNEDGPAVLYKDGFSVWAINGKRVTEQIVLRPETLTIEQINKESDQDLRAIMIERFGWPKYLEETNAECIDTNDNIIENSKEALYKSPFGNRLVVTCPTGRVFALGVPEHIQNCDDAQKWLGSSEEESINVIART
jgi:hypothetical protein